MGICETFLRGKSKLNIPNYKWYGQNCKWITKTAKRGSGGIGFLIHERVLQKFVVVELDNDVEKTKYNDFYWHLINLTNLNPISKLTWSKTFKDLSNPEESTWKNIYNMPFKE